MVTLVFSASTCLLFFSFSFHKVVSWVTGSPSAANGAFLWATLLPQWAAAVSQLALVCFSYVRAYCWPCRDQTKMTTEREAAKTMYVIFHLWFGLACLLPLSFWTYFPLALVGLGKKCQSHSLRRQSACPLKSCKFKTSAFLDAKK